MSTFRRIVLLVVLLASSAAPALADSAPKWSDTELTAFADVILTGRVADIATDWDGDTIYTYVTLDVADVVKGWIPERQIVLKQLGGRVDGVALVIGGQAVFSRGENVLVFLEVRPRDRTLSTTALWQGKWTITTSGATGDAVARRAAPAPDGERALGSEDDARSLHAFAEQIRQAADRSAAQPSRTEINVRPRDASAAVPVRDVDAARIFSPRRPADQTIGAPTAADIQRNGRCFTRFTGDGGLSIAAENACGEMSPTGGTLAVSGAWVDTTTGRGADRTFMQILQAGVITNAASAAGGFLAKPSCAAAIEAHEIRHALGEHVDASQPFLDRSCGGWTTSSVLTLGGARGVTLNDRRDASAQAAAAGTIQTTRVSVASDGSQANGPSITPSISADGRYVVFISQAPSLTGAASTVTSVILHDNQTGQTMKIGDTGTNTAVRITADGRYVIFHQAGLGNNAIAVYDRTTATTSTITVAIDPSFTGIVSVSDDLRYVAYLQGSSAGPPARPGYVLDRQTGAANRVPSDTDGVSALILSPDGRYVAYQIPTGGGAWLFDRLSSQSVRVGGTGSFSIAFSTDNRFLLFNGGIHDVGAARTSVSLPGSALAISANGRYVAYIPSSSLSGPAAIHVYDQQAATTLRVTVDSNGVAANGASATASVDNNGNTAYQSSATNLVAGDTNGADDIFLTSGGVDASLPDRPTGLSSTVTRTGSTSFVSLSWNAPTVGAVPTNYIILAGSKPGGTDLAAFLTGSTSPSFSTTVSGSGTFFVRVAAVSAGGSGPSSNEIVVTVGGASAPGAPGNLQVLTSGSTVTLIWNAPTTGDPPSTYVIQASSNPGGAANLANFSTGNTATTFTATNVGAGTYFVRVLAANAVGMGLPSNEVSLLVLGPPPPCTGPPAPPNGLRSTVSGSTVMLQWNASVGPTTTYVVEAGSASGLSDLANFDTGNTANSLTVNGVGNGTYFVRIRGRNTCGASAASNEVVVAVR